MKLAIIGSGNIGGALAKSLARKGHHIIIGARDPSSPALLNLLNEERTLSSDTPPDAVRPSDIIIMALPLSAIPDVVPTLGDLAGKIVIETSNIFGQPLPKYVNGVQAIKALSGNMDVVKAFNSIGSEDLANPAFGNDRADTFVAGDSGKAKAAVATLARDLGFANCYDLGGDYALPLLESLAAIWATLAYKEHIGRRCAIKVLHD